MTETSGPAITLKGQWVSWERDLRDHQDVISVVSKSSSAKYVLESTLDSFEDVFSHIKMHIQTFIFKCKFNEHRHCGNMTLITKLISILEKDRYVSCFPRNCIFIILISDSFQKFLHLSLLKLYISRLLNESNNESPRGLYCSFSIPLSV